MFPDETMTKDPRIIAAMRRARRRYERAQRRDVHARYHAANGLNGPRAVARRLRQIAAGSLRVSV